MRSHEFLPESSPDTPMGSVTPDLMKSKLWLCQKLISLGETNFDRIYILGSWYGALALIMRRLPFEYRQIVCVDSSPEKARYLNRLLRKHKIQDIISVCDRAENINYHEDEILVINTSTNDIVGTEWFRRIPTGSTVVIQGRDNQEDSNGVETLEIFDEQYLLDEEFYLGELKILGVDQEPYRRFMKIGIR